MALHHSYTVLAPIYDAIVATGTRPMRVNSLKRLGADDNADIGGKDILISGVGTGLDIPHLPRGANYTGVDITPAMLKRAHERMRKHELDIELTTGNVMALDFPDAHYDIVLMHLILAVVPEPEKALAEATRVLKPGGRILILDKFLRPGQRAPLRRLLNMVIRHIATRTDVVFEAVLETCPELSVIEDTHAIPGGWFRHIVLQKQDT